MVTIFFEAHGTSVDNEANRSSGHYDAELSSLGKKQARELGSRYEGRELGAVFCSDLRRAYETADIAFAERSTPIIRDMRIRECNYGDFNHRPDDEVVPYRGEHIKDPFPNGESYEQTNARMKIFLDQLSRDYSGKTVLIIGHRATQYALECFINKKTLQEAIAAPWQWQPGWVYQLKKI
jgi:broad specificity phosphatase PhoE